MKSFFNRLDLMLSMSYDPEIVDLLDAVKKYIKTGVCLDYKNKMAYLLYWGWTADSVADMLGVKASTVRFGRKTMSDHLYDQFGYDFFGVVETNPQKARMRFEIIRQQWRVDTLFLPGVSVLLPTPKDIYEYDIDVKSCQEEIKFLKKHAKIKIEKEMQDLDPEKLGYLLSIINTGGGGGTPYYFKLIGAINN